ncbi:MAG: PH domain-containing protein [bacterium]|nr:PH domain-containing protein [bacterium]
MQESYELKPNKSVFVTFKFLIGFFFSCLILTIIWLVASRFVPLSILYFLAAFIVIESISFYALSVKYKKEKYIFLADKIIRKSGGILSEKETELVIRNITHVDLKLPYVENKIFKTGSIGIESAGTSAAEIVFHSIDKPQQFYEYVEKLMKHNGFRLTKSKLIQKERPSSLGVFFEVFKNFIGVIIALLYVSPALFPGIAILIVEPSAFNLNTFLIFLAIAIVVTLLFLHFNLKFLDLKRRVYYIYSDTITYSEGFLTKNFSFIPIENLADSTVTQTLIDRIFSLYDVKISCQGTDQDILFKNMRNGPTLEENIDSLISKSKSLVGTAKTTKKADVKKQAAYKEKELQKDTAFTGQYSMDGSRTIMPLIVLAVILFPFAFIFIPIIIVSFIEIVCTKYFVKPGSMEKKYDFLSSKHIEFTNEKITAIIFRESFIDKWFNTCSINFWSIGSSEDITFKNIKKSEGLYKTILAKAGIKRQEVLYRMDSAFKLPDMLKSALPVTIISILLIVFSITATIFLSPFIIILAIIIVLIFIATLIYETAYYKRSKLTFFKECVFFTKGIFFKHYYYVLYNNIKDISTEKFPFSQAGSVKFNVAGEHVVQQGKNASVTSNSFKINYIQGIENKDELIDLIFFQRPTSQKISEIEQNIESFTQKPIMTVKPSLANPLTILLVVSFLFPPLLLLLPLSLTLTIMSVKARTYIIQPYRVLAKSGILYKAQTSILFAKVDHIIYKQGALNKLYKNGTILVNTAGSSSPELVLNNAPNFKDFYEELKKYY